MPEKILEGKVAIVTGGALGIGRSIAEVFAREQAKVIIVDINHEGDRTRWEINKKGGQAHFLTGDVRRWKGQGLRSCQEIVEWVLNAFGRIDILVNNAGAQTGKGLLELSDDEIKNITNLNYLGPFKLIQLVARSMIERGIGGSIVNITSAHAEMIRGFPEYSGSKAALAMLTKEAAFELGQYGIRVNAVIPGATDSEMNREFFSDPKNRKGFASKVPLGRIGKPEEVAEVVLFLVSDKGSSFTGVDWSCCGGDQLRNISVEEKRFPIQE